MGTTPRRRHQFLGIARSVKRMSKNNTGMKIELREGELENHGRKAELRDGREFAGGWNFASVYGI